MKKITIFLAMIIVFNFNLQVRASTSFAVYSKTPLYGVNLDLNETDLMFRILEGDGKKVFFVTYTGQKMFNGNGYLPTVSMNDRGLFVSSQIELPKPFFAIEQTEEQVELGDLVGETFLSFNSVAEVEERIWKKRLVNSEISLHCLFADVTGASAILEARESNVIHEGEEGISLMTELPIALALDPSTSTELLDETARYNLAYEIITNNFVDFDISKAFKVLEESAQSWRGGGTLCSMVFDPIKAEVYLTLNQDYSKVWKISIAAGTIETWSGFSEYSKNIIGTGITVGELLHPKSFLKKHGLYIAIIGVLACWIIIGMTLRQRRIKRFIPKQMEW